MANAYTNEEIIEKLKKIKAHEESAREIGSIDEAEVFAKVFQKLLVDYELSMNDVEFTHMRNVSTIEKTLIDWDEYHVKVGQNIRHMWIEYLTAIVARAYGCAFMIRTGSSHIWIIGRETNRHLAEYVLVMLVRSADSISRKESATFSRRCRKEGRPEVSHGYRKSFLIGFVLRINDRLKEARHPTASSGSTAIVRIATESGDARDWMRQTLHIRQAADLTIAASENCIGFQKGQTTANRMDIRGRGIGNSPRKKLG